MQDLSTTAKAAADTSRLVRRERPPTGAPARVDPAQFRRAVLDHLLYTCVKEQAEVSAHDLYRAMAHTVRDRRVLD